MKEIARGFLGKLPMWASFFSRALAESAFRYWNQKKIYDKWAKNGNKWENIGCFAKTELKNGKSWFTIRLQKLGDAYYRNCKSVKLIKKEQKQSFNLLNAKKDFLRTAKKSPRKVSKKRKRRYSASLPMKNKKRAA